MKLPKLSRSLQAERRNAFIKRRTLNLGPGLEAPPRRNSQKLDEEGKHPHYETRSKR
jgi:hypothetical protein